MSRTREEYEAIAAKLREAGLPVKESSQTLPDGRTLTATEYDAPSNTSREEAHRLLDIAIDAGAPFCRMGASTWIWVSLTERAEAEGAQP